MGTEASIVALPEEVLQTDCVARWQGEGRIVGNEWAANGDVCGGHFVESHVLSVPGPDENGQAGLGLPPAHSNQQ